MMAYNVLGLARLERHGAWDATVGTVDGTHVRWVGFIGLFEYCTRSTVEDRTGSAAPKKQHARHPIRMRQDEADMVVHGEGEGKACLKGRHKQDYAERPSAVLG